MIVLLEIVTAARLLDFLWFLIFKKTELSIPVLSATGIAMILAVLCILFYRAKTVSLRIVIAIYAVHVLVILFNIVYTSVFSPLNITAADFLMIGNFFEILVYLVFIILGIRHLRSQYSVIKSLLHYD